MNKISKIKRKLIPFVSLTFLIPVAATTSLFIKSVHDSTTHVLNLENTNVLAVSDTTYKYLTITANTARWNEIFPGNKGFGVDILNSTTAQKEQMKTSLQIFLNNNVDLVLTNPPPNPNIVVDEIITTSNTNSLIAITSNLYRDGEIVEASSSAYIKLETLDTPTSVSKVFVNLKTTIQDKLMGFSTTPTIQDIKQIIVDYLNANLKDIPDTYIPTTGSLTTSNIFNADQVIQIDEANKIVKFNGQIAFGRVESNIINLPNLGDISYLVNEDTNSTPILTSGGRWQPYVVFGTTGALILLLFILIIAYIIKRSKNKNQESDD